MISCQLVVEHLPKHNELPQLLYGRLVPEIAYTSDLVEYFLLAKQPFTLLNSTQSCPKWGLKIQILYVNELKR